MSETITTTCENCQTAYIGDQQWRWIMLWDGRRAGPYCEHCMKLGVMVVYETVQY